MMVYAGELMQEESTFGAGSMTPLVGRARELAELAQATTTGPALILIEGEAGIGKSRLVKEFLSASQLSSLIAHCPPLPEPFPLGPIIDLLRRTCHNEIVRMKTSELTGALRPLFPEWSSFLPAAPEPLDDSRAARHRLFRALDELFTNLAADVLVVEDVHWADESTLEFLLFTCSKADYAGTLVLTCRPEEVPEKSLLRRIMASHPAGAQHVRLPLSPLGSNQVSELVSHMLNAESVSAEFSAFLHRHTGGIPFVLEETINLLRDRADIVRREDTWVRRALEDLVVPTTVRDSIMERVSHLRRSAQRILNAASVLSRSADEKTLTTVSGLAPAQAQIGLEQAVTSGLLCEVETGRFELRHVLVGRAIYQSITASQRRLAHRRAARVLEKVKPSPVVDLTQHFKFAGDTKRWALYAEQSAELAAAAGDERTVVLLTLEILNTVALPVSKKARLGAKLARAALHGGALVAEQIPDILGMLRRVLNNDDLPRTERGKIRLDLGVLLLRYGNHHEGCAEIEQAIGELEAAPELAARAMAFFTLWLGAKPPLERQKWLEQAVALLARMPSEAERITLRTYCAIGRVELGDMTGWEVAENLPADAATLEEKRRLAYSYASFAFWALIWGRYDRAEKWLVAADRLVNENAFLAVRNDVQINRAWLSYYTGRWSGLIKAAAQLESSDETWPVGQIEARCVHGLIALATGDIQVGEKELESVLCEYQGPGLEDLSMVPSAVLGRLRLANDDPEAAVALTRAGMDRIATTGMWTWAADIAPVHIEALIRAGELARAEELLEDFEAGLRGRAAPAPEVALIVCRALVAEGAGEPREAAELFAMAADAWAALPRPYDELLMAERQARSLLTAGERDQALALLTTVEQRLSALGARWDADRVAHLLREYNISVKRTWRRGRKGYGDRLSPREIDVVRLIADGLTNKQIAESLYLSPATVTSHIASAMRKLGVSSRTALVLSAAQTGLIPDIGTTEN